MPNWKPEIKQRLTPLRLASTRENAIVEELAQGLDGGSNMLTANGVGG